MNILEIREILEIVSAISITLGAQPDVFRDSSAFWYSLDNRLCISYRIEPSSIMINDNNGLLDQQTYYTLCGIASRYNADFIINE
jgi:hypothetical protein